MAHGPESDLHGNAPDRSPTVLLLVDVLNDLAFPKNEHLLTQAPRVGAAIARLKHRCTEAGIPSIYVNDNHGKWQSNVDAVLANALREDSPGRKFVEALRPAPQDYVVLKPKHSGFFATPLEVLLQSIGAKTLILAGITANACVLVTAGDAYVHGYRIYIPSDCVASLTPEAQEHALQLLRESFAADTRKSDELDLAELNRPQR